MMQSPIEVQRSAKRLVVNSDFNLVLDHLLTQQVGVVLSMEAGTDRLDMAKIYFDALRDVPGLVVAIAQESENGG